MSSEEGVPKSRQLSANQRVLLHGFVEHFTDDSKRAIQHIGYYDLVAANLRDALAKQYNQLLDTPEVYYPVMAGLSLASEWIHHLVKDGVPFVQAVALICSTPNLEQRAEAGFKVPMNDPTSRSSVLAGVSVTLDWISNLVERGLEIDQAVEVVRDGFALLAPDGSVPPKA